MSRKPPTVRGIRAILRKAGVPLSELKAEVKYGPRYSTPGADVYSLPGRRGMLLNAFVEWVDESRRAVKLPEPARVALDAAGYVVDANALVRHKETA